MAGILAAALVLFKEPNPTVTPRPEPTSTTETKSADGMSEIIYDENGFAPREITVAKGTTINFDNRTEIPMWVASDSHPEHADYPEFDVIRVDGEYPAPRNDYSFTFDKTGKWTYHNHTVPEHTATITVN